MQEDVYYTLCSTQCVHSNHVVCVIVCSMHMQPVQCTDVQMGGIQSVVQVEYSMQES